MKDSLFMMLMNFFEKSLLELAAAKAEPTNLPENNEGEGQSIDNNFCFIKKQRATSMRIFTLDEQVKLTKDSYQFIMRMVCWGVLDTEKMETILSELLLSESQFVTLAETKWTIRNKLSEQLNDTQLAFLDLVLYQKEDELQLQ